MLSLKLQTIAFAKATDDCFSSVVIDNRFVYYVYILRSSKSDILYCGYTRDLKRRFWEHNIGKSKFTKGHIPWKLVWYCAFEKKEMAKDFELYLKSGSGKAFVCKRLVDLVLTKKEIVY